MPAMESMASVAQQNHRPQSPGRLALPLCRPGRCPSGHLPFHGVRHGACQNRVTFRKLCTNTYCLAMALILFAVWVLFFLSRLEVLA